MTDETIGPVFIYADESWVEIEGKKHLVLGAIITKEPGLLASQIVRLKKSLGLEPFDEIKWNTDRFTEDQRNKLSDGIIRIIQRCTGLISIVEGQDKQLAVKLLAFQAADYCRAAGIPAYLLYLDYDLVQRPREFAQFVMQTQGSLCIGFQVLDSRYDQLMQCADVFVGFYRAAIRQELGAKTKFIPNTDESFDGIRDAWTLTEYVTLGTRGMLWGNIDPLDERGFVYMEYPLKKAMGLGFRLQSSISLETRSLLEQNIATVYMGCLH